MNKPEMWREWGRSAPFEALRRFERGDLTGGVAPRAQQFRLKIRDCEQLDLEVFPGANQIDLDLGEHDAIDR